MNKNHQLKPLVIILFLLILSFSSISNLLADRNNNIVTEQLRIILPPPVARTTSAYGVIENMGDTQDTLINVSSDAGMVMLHKTELNDGIAQMKHIDNYVFESGAKLILKPFSYHLMLMNINHDVIKSGSEVLLTLEFKKAGKLKIKVPVVSE